MYAFFRGIVYSIADEYIVLDVNNIGYKIYTTKDVLYRYRLGDNVLLHTYTSVREDAFMLYGFDNEDDLELFKLLITVSGIGPKMGLSILSSIDANSIKMAIISQDSKLLSSANGVGNKTANRIILELKDKIGNSDIIATSKQDVKNDKVLEIRNEAYEALVSLGISPVNASKALNEIEINEDSKIENIIKMMLARF